MMLKRILIVLTSFAILSSCSPRLMSQDQRAERGKRVLASALTQSEVVSLHAARDASTASVIANVEMQEDTFCFDLSATRSAMTGNWVHWDRTDSVRQFCWKYSAIYYITSGDLRVLEGEDS